MTTINYKELFSRVISNPSESDPETISMLIERYPYTQPLRYIQAAQTADEEATSKALLYAGDPSWLHEYLHMGSGDALTGEDDSKGIMDVVEEESRMPPAGENPLDAVASGSDAVPHISDEAVVTAQNDYPFAIDDPEAAAADEILRPVAADYLAYEKPLADEDVVSAQKGEGHVPPHGEIVPLSQATPHEKISLYNDEHMPYSFLWWLNKTRMEHAGTYQPYAPTNPKSAPEQQDSAYLPEEEKEKDVLNHQIRENIFHLQAPEDKLSDIHQVETISFQIPKKIDPAIERFIRDEPQIKPPQADKLDLENKARKSAEDQLTLVTETLAKIYAEQGLYPKAIDVYKKLSLRYPEKSAYFAAQIDELENKLT